MKLQRITLSDLAVSDILEQADWYEARSEGLAVRWEKAVRSALLRIARSPGAGALCQFRADQLRDTRRSTIPGFPKHLIFYQVDKSALVVLRVIHGARDLESLFSD